jgi:hypothetical protein
MVFIILLDDSRCEMLHPFQPPISEYVICHIGRVINIMYDFLFNDIKQISISFFDNLTSSCFYFYFRLQLFPS